MRITLERILWAAALFGAAALAWHLARWSAPGSRADTAPDTIRVAAERPEPAGPAAPSVVELYRPLPESDSKPVCPENPGLDVPESWDRPELWMPREGFYLAGLVGRQPIERLAPDRIGFRYFDPRAARYVRETYQFDEPTVEIWPSIGLARTALGAEGRLRANVRLGRFLLHGGYALDASNLEGRESGRIVAGISFRPFILRF